MGNQIEQIVENLSKPENERVKIRSEKKSKIDKKIKQLIQKEKQSGAVMVAVPMSTKTRKSTGSNPVLTAK